MDARAERTSPMWALWALGFLALVAANALWTLRIFDALEDPARLLQPTPIVSGRHALHGYHGSLGAQAWLANGGSSAFDPAYQAGYPKSPVFDSGCRPAEFFYLPGHKRSFVSYKVGVFACCLLFPALFALMAVGLELNARAVLLAGLLGTVLGWSHLNADLLIDGELDILIAGAAALLHCCWQIRFAHRPSFHGWAILLFSGAVAWYIQPVFALVFVPPVVAHYLWNAAKHRPLWHLGLFASWVGALAPNGPWLREWSQSIGHVFPIMDEPSGPGGWTHLWRSGGELVPTDPLVIAWACVGAVGLPYLAIRHFSGFLILVLSSLSLFAASFAHRLWPMLEEVQLGRLLSILVWFAVFPAAHLLEAVGAACYRKLGMGTGFIWMVMVVGGSAFLAEIPQRWGQYPKLRIGLDESQSAIVEKLQRSDPAARILWEDCPSRKADDGWTSLLAPLTSRTYLGGLDSENRMEYFYARLVDGRLGGRDITEWSDGQLDRFFRRYNVGRAAVRTEDAVARLRAYPGAVEENSTGLPVRLFALRREPNFFLKGRGHVAEASWRRIVLEGVEPDGDEVVLSLHFQEGWTVSPGAAAVERQIDADDPIPFVRLRGTGTASRLVLEWKRR